MKQAAILILGVILLPFLLVSGVNLVQQNAAWVPQFGSPSATPATQMAEVTVKIEDGSTTTTIPNVSASNALEALEVATEDEGLSIKTQTFEFGTLVVGIEGKENTDELSWIYFVNDQPGDVAAEQKDINDGDVVSWRYIKPE